jgi:hypothetical protein
MKNHPFTANFLKSILLLTTGGCFLVTSLILLGVWRAGANFMSGVTTLFTPTPSPPQVDVPTLVIQQVRGVSELTTTVFVMDAVVPASQDRKMGELTVGTTKLLYMAQGEVRAGVDLMNLDTRDVTIAEDQITVLLPPPEILDSKIDVNHSQVYHYDRGFLGLGPDVAPQLQTLAQRKTLNKIMSAACEQGVLVEANEKADLAVTKLLQTAGYTNVEVETTPPGANACRVRPQLLDS